MYWFLAEAVSTPDCRKLSIPMSSSLVGVISGMSSCPPRGSRSTRGARGSARGRGSKHHTTGRIIWHPVDSAEDNPHTTPPKRRANYLNNTYTASSSGRLSSRTSYISATTSPKKQRIHSEPQWNQSLPIAADEDDQFWKDPAYSDFLQDSATNLPKPKQGRRVGRLFSTQ
jgi:hypothetical protein